MFTSRSLYLTKESPICLRDAKWMQRSVHSVPQYRHGGIGFLANTCERMAPPSRRFGSMARNMWTETFATVMKTSKILLIDWEAFSVASNASISLSLRTIGKRSWSALRAARKKKSNFFIFIFARWFWEITVHIITAVKCNHIAVDRIKISGRLANVTRFTFFAEIGQLARVLGERDRTEHLKALNCIHSNLSLIKKETFRNKVAKRIC